VYAYGVCVRVCSLTHTPGRGRGVRTKSPRKQNNIFAFTYSRHSFHGSVSRPTHRNPCIHRVQPGLVPIRYIGIRRLLYFRAFSGFFFRLGLFPARCLSSCSTCLWLLIYYLIWVFFRCCCFFHRCFFTLDSPRDSCNIIQNT